MRHNDIAACFSTQASQYLNYLSQELLFAARPDEMFVLAKIQAGINDPELIFSSLADDYKTMISAKKIQAIRNILSLATSVTLQKKYNLSLIVKESLQFEFSSELNEYLKQVEFKELFGQVIELGLSYFSDYPQLTKDNNDFVLYHKYSRKEFVRLLNVNLSLETSIYGYRVLGWAIPIFITYRNSANKLASDNYENTFLNNQDLIWYSRGGSQISNPEVQDIIHHGQQDRKIVIFVKKSKNEGSEHYYFGYADVVNYHAEIFNGAQRVKFILRLQIALSDSDFDYILN